MRCAFADAQEGCVGVGAAQRTALQFAATRNSAHPPAQLGTPARGAGYETRSSRYAASRPASDTAAYRTD